jgi:hypothetical protein
MMRAMRRSLILSAVLVAVLLLTLPGIICRIVHTGELCLFTRDFFADILARLSGPGKLSFILQPAVATFLGTRDGVNDSQAESPVFLWSLVFHKRHATELLRNTLASMRDLVAVAILLDIISQLLIFRVVHPCATLLVRPALIALPYALAQSSASRIARWRSGQAPVKRAS